MKKLFPFLISGFLLPQLLWPGDLGRYQLILDKQLLGIEKSTPTVVNVAAPVAAIPSWSRDYRMTMITQDENRIRVGLQSLKDSSALLLIEGENSDVDFQLVSGNYQQGTAVIRYRGSEHQFSLESGSVNQSKPQSQPTADRGSRRSGNTGSLSPRSYRSRSPVATPSEENVPPPPQVPEFKSREELQVHLQQQQMDAIRTGKPPLPIPLTREMDDQLVKEGVLPPQK